MPEDDAFLRAIVENPGDESALLVYADWLEEKGDIRAEYLRLFHQARVLPSRLQELSRQIDSKWLASVTRGRGAGKLIVEFDLDAEKGCGVAVKSATAVYLTAKSAVRIIGEAASDNGTSIKNSRCIHAIVFDAFGDPIGRNDPFRAYWAKFNVRQSFDIPVSLLSPDLTPSIVRVFPSYSN